METPGAQSFWSHCTEGQSSSDSSVAPGFPPKSGCWDLSPAPPTTTGPRPIFACSYFRGTLNPPFAPLQAELVFVKRAAQRKPGSWLFNGRRERRRPRARVWG